jgi:hypothetical protein
MTTTDFHPDVDGFAFINRFHYDDAEKQNIIDTVKAQKEALLAIFAAVTAADIVLSFFGIPPGLVDSGAVAVLSGAFDQCIKNMIPSSHEGWCGGVAFTAADYFNASWLPDRGVKQAGDDDDGVPDVAGRAQVLRKYIWQRHLDSLTSGGALGTLEAIFYLHVVDGGVKTLAGKTRDEWKKLKAFIDAGTPWPICVVGTSPDPTHGHQVVAIGYDEPSPGVANIHVYDVDNPGEVGMISLDLRGDSVTGTWPGTGSGLTEPRHFFCSAYAAKTPPIAVGLSAGVTVKYARAAAGAPVSVSFRVENVGLATTPALVPVVNAYRPPQPATAPTPPPGRGLLGRLGLVRVRPLDPVTVPTPPEQDPPDLLAPVTAYFSQPGIGAAPLAVGASVGVDATWSMREGSWRYYGDVEVTSSDGHLVYRRAPVLEAGTTEYSSTYVPFPKPTPAPTTSGKDGKPPAPGPTGQHGPLRPH